MKPLEDIGERKALLTKIIQSMPGDGKKVSWVQHFEAHPGDAALLGYNRGLSSADNPIWNRNNVMASHMIRTGQVKKGGANRVQNHPANVAALKQTRFQSAIEAGEALALKPYAVKAKRNARRASYSDEDYRLAASIADVYKRPDITGRLSVDWHAAFEKHPEWLQQLQGRRSQKALQAFLARVRTKIAKGKLPSNPVADVLEAAVTGHPAPEANGGNGDNGSNEIRKLQAQVERLQDELQAVLKLCPECGYDLRFHQQAYRLARKHSRLIKS